MKKIILLAALLLIGMNICESVFAEKSKQTADAYYAEGLGYIEKHQYEKAIVVLEKSLERDANSAEVYHELGSCYHALRDFPKALSCFQKGIDVNQNYADNYIAIGSAYYNLGQSQKAKEYLIKAMAILKTQSDYKRIASVQHLIDVFEQKGY